MLNNFELSIVFALRDGKEIRYNGKWSGENGVSLHASPIEMIQEETPDSLATLLIENIGTGPFYNFTSTLNEDSEFIKAVKAIPSMNEIARIMVQGILGDEEGHVWNRLFEYDAGSKIMNGTSTGDSKSFPMLERCGDLSFSESTLLTSPRFAQEDGTYKGIFYNETEDEKRDRLYAEFNAKMKAFKEKYGNAKDAFLANLKRFKSYPDVERALEIMNYDEKIEFPDKYILVYGCPESYALSREIEGRGAFYRDRAVKKADFFVLWDPDDEDGYHHSAIEKMLDFRTRGGEAVFVTAYQLWEALNEGANSSMSQDELEMLNLEREEKKILAEMDKIREKMLEEEQKLENKRRKEEEKQKSKAAKEQAKAPKEKEQPTKDSTPGKKPAKKKEKEDPLFAMLNAAIAARGLTLEDLVGPEDEEFSLDDLDFDDEDEEDDEFVKEFKQDVADCIQELTQKYNGKPRFASYAALKKENPDYFWDDLEDTIKNYIFSTPAAYFKEAGLVRSGTEKIQIIGNAEAEQEPAETEKTAPKEKTATTSPAPKKEPEKTAVSVPKSKPEASANKAPKQPANRAAITPAIVIGDIRQPRLKGTVVAADQFKEEDSDMPYVIPEGVTEIDQNAFHFSKTTSITCPKSLRIIKSSGVASCKNLEHFEIPEGLEEIRMLAFAFCPKLKKIRLPSTIMKVARDAFRTDLYDEEKAVVTIELPGIAAQNLVSTKKNKKKSAVLAEGFVIDGKAYRTLEDYVDTHGSGETIHQEQAINKPVPASVPVAKPSSAPMADNTFHIPHLKDPTVLQTKELYIVLNKKIEIPEGVTRVQENAMTFEMVEELKFPRSLRIIEKNAFANNHHICKIIFQEGLKEIGECAFFNPKALKEVTLPDSIEKVWYNAFSNDYISYKSHVIVRISGKAAERLYNNRTSSRFGTLQAGGFIIDGKSYKMIEDYIAGKQEAAKARENEERKKAAEERAKQEELRRQAEAIEKSQRDMQQRLDRLQQKTQRMTELVEKITALQREREAAKGLLAFMKRNKIDKEIEALKIEISKL